MKMGLKLGVESRNDGGLHHRRNGCTGVGDDRDAMGSRTQRAVQAGVAGLLRRAAMDMDCLHQAEGRDYHHGEQRHAFPQWRGIKLEIEHHSRCFVLYRILRGGVGQRAAVTLASCSRLTR